MNVATNVRVEHLDRPSGIGDREPRLSWRLPAEATTSSLVEATPGRAFQPARSPSRKLTSAPSM